MHKLSAYLKAGYPVLYIQTGEQERALRAILEDLKVSRLSDVLDIYVWKITTGMAPFLAKDPQKEAIASDFRDAMRVISTGMDGQPRPDSLYVFFNIREMLQNPANRQAFRDAASDIKRVGSYMIVVGGHLDLPEELSDVVTFVDFHLPTREEIKAIFSRVVTKYTTQLGLQVSDQELESAAENATGLSEFKAENAISLSLVERRGIDIELLRHEKQMAVKQSGVLEFMPHTETMDSLGGFDVLKDFVVKRRKYYANVKNAESFGLRPPKGLLMVGVAGAGKTLAGKAISAALNLPLYKFNVGAIFKGLVGASEAAVREAIKLAETVSPCVLLLDEFEKGFTGLESSGKSDSGVTSRVISTLLTWMQETKAPIYKVATCNTIRNLDAALFRRGRWDAVFAVDLPASEERQQIFAIHLRKRGRDVSKFDLASLAKASDNFVGAEIESVVDEALYNAFDADRELTTDDLLHVCRGVVPIAKTDAEEISKFRSWMENRATMVSSVRAKAVAGSRGTARNRARPGTAPLR